METWGGPQLGISRSGNGSCDVSVSLLVWHTFFYVVVFLFLCRFYVVSVSWLLVFRPHSFLIVVFFWFFRCPIEPFGGHRGVHVQPMEFIAVCSCTFFGRSAQGLLFGPVAVAAVVHVFCKFQGHASGLLWVSLSSRALVVVRRSGGFGVALRNVAELIASSKRLRSGRF